MLLQLSDGTLTTKPAELVWATDGFERTTVYRCPSVNARSGLAGDVGALLRFGRDHGIVVVARAEGRSAFGEA